MARHAVLSLSGGMDSSTLLLHLLATGHQVTALSFDYGQKHKVELERAKSLVEYINDTITFGSEVTHQVIKLDGLSPLLNSHLVEGGEDVPEGHYEDDNMKDTVVPNRNKIFSSIIQAVALSLANKNKSSCKIAMGIHSGDHAIYPDCRQEFRDADHKAFVEGNWDSQWVEMYTPYLLSDKLGILKDGEENCKMLGLDFDEVYKRTLTSYKPIQVWQINPEKGYKLHTTGLNQGRFYKWFSDYKSASSVERVEAFIDLGRPDPAEYADETGPVDWKTVKNHVSILLTNHKNV